MKKIALILSAVCLALTLNAQPAKSDAAKQKAKEMKEAAQSRIQAEHIAYLTTELELTPEEAQVFWPVYNKAQAEQKELNKATRAAQKALKMALKEGKSDDEITEAMNGYIKAKKAQRHVLSDYQKDFIKVIGVAKTAKLYVAEEGFRSKQINRLGEGKGKGPGQGYGEGGGHRGPGQGERPNGGQRPHGDR
jgi:Spy/CpxP family protein refolding chaperone